ncbi:uncharacterized protein G2W53_021511 [Senna tora]|uniref:Uncharacterized protein n=1 Tax=Senna tora TaxID=362788 RepID=A0A834TL82_9FABA|nr:uncharacterized protein G2W53_021511 [Senna tora]
MRAESNNSCLNHSESEHGNGQRWLRRSEQDSIRFLTLTAKDEMTRDRFTASDKPVPQRIGDNKPKSLGERK